VDVRAFIKHGLFYLNRRPPPLLNPGGKDVSDRAVVRFAQGESGGAIKVAVLQLIQKTSREWTGDDAGFS